jgi:hypothetical protein
VQTLELAKDGLTKNVCTCAHNLLLTAALYDGGHV